MFRLAFGYRSVEVLPEPKLSVEDLSFDFHDIVCSIERPPCARDLGPSLKGATLPRCDRTDPKTMEEGVKKRMGQALPVPYSKKFLKLLKKEVKIFIKERKLKSIARDRLYTIEEWLALTGYPQWRKEELIALWNETYDLKERHTNGRLRRFFIKLFPKDEPYIDFKHERGIWAREDAAKLFMGPIFKAMEDQIYDTEINPEFIKHVPHRDRAAYVLNRLYRPGMRYVATDYTAYESHFTKELMRYCEFVLYKHFLKHHPDEYSILCEVLMGKNTAFNKFFTVNIDGRRMSGEMNTSLGNGFSNLIIMRTVCRMKGITNLVGVVEGDDGLFAFADTCPTSCDFTSQGFNIKLDTHDEISRASFCGLIFDPTDRNIITDPRKVLASFGWTGFKYAACNKKTAMKLLRCKSLSLAHQYPGCPIVSELASYGLRITRSYNVDDFIARRRDIDLYERDKLIEASRYFKLNKDELSIPVREIGYGTRLLVEELYGIDVKAQLSIESKICNKQDTTPFDLPEIMSTIPTSWQLYDAAYVLERPDSRKCQIFAPSLRSVSS